MASCGTIGLIISLYIMEKIHNTKASEIYVDVTFKYESIEKNWYIPIKNRRDGTDYEDASDDEIKKYIEKVKVVCHPNNWDQWKSDQTHFWKNINSPVTKPIFDLLVEDFDWVCADDFENPNYARRIQQLKEFGYTVISGVKKYHPVKKEKATYVLLIPMPRGGIHGYEQWDKSTRNKIIKTLNSYDAYEGKKTSSHGLLPDHKFPEIRWDKKTKRSSDDLAKLTENEIKRDFQLITNQRNLQKREVCRKCYQTNERGIIFGIDYFYYGKKKWDDSYPTTGKQAEQGCKGCGWYDIEKWRESLNKNHK